MTAIDMFIPLSRSEWDVALVSSLRIGESWSELYFYIPARKDVAEAALEEKLAPGT